MTSEDPRLKTALWWITSIAIAVVCCSSLFVLFANYLVDMKAELRDVNARLSILEERANNASATIDLLRARLPQNAAAKTGAEPVAETPLEPGIAVEGKSGPAAGELVPATAAEAPAAAAAVAPHAPAVSVPVLPPATEKK